MYHFAYTDGSARGNPGPGGWAVLLDGKYLYSGYFDVPVTNNQMELYAIYMDIEAAPGHCDLTIFTDSRLAFGYYAKHWKVNKLHHDIVKVTVDLALLKNILWHFEWVKGHENNSFNAKVDKAARAQSGIAQSIMFSTSKA